MGFKLGQLVIELAANTARLQQDMGKAVAIAESGAARIKDAFAFVTAGAGGGLIGAALIGAAKNAIEFGDNLNKAAIKAGIGGKAMSELAYAAKLADVDIQSLSIAIKKMQVSLSEAGTGSKSALLALDALGLTVDQLQKRKPEAQFELIADRISKLADPADRARAATELFGKAGADLLPMFSEGAKGIEKALGEARKLGLSFTDEQLGNLSSADDSIKRLSASWSGFAATLTAEVAPALSNTFDKLSGLDTRSQEEKIKALSADIQSRRGFGLGGGVGGMSADQEASAYQELANMRGMIELQQVRQLQTGTSGGPANRRDFGSAIGFARADAEEAARDAAAKAKAAQEKENAAFLVQMEKANDAYFDSFGKSLDRQTDDFADAENAQYKLAQEFAEKRKQTEEDVAKWRDQQASRSALMFKDTILAAFDDMVNGTKIKWSEMLKYLALQTARAGLVKLLDSSISSSSTSSSSGGKSGFWSTVGSFVGSLFSSDVQDGKASGGPVSAGRLYPVGEKGMELFRPSMNGTIIPNNALGAGGGWVIAPAYHIYNPDNTERLPAILKENNRRLVESLSRAGALRN